MESQDISTSELIKLALNEKDDEARWNYVQTLHQRGNIEVFDIAKNLCESDDSKKITLGADVLGQIGISIESIDLPFKKESVPVLLNLTETNLKSSKNEEDVIAFQSVIFALGRMNDEKAREKILEFTEHQSEDVRSAVVHGILAIEAEDEINALIKLSNDTDEDVRNWATFGLGSQIETNTEEIRQALFNRLNEKTDNDVCDEIRGEALVGLAIRKDERVIAPLIQELSMESVGILAVEAASEISDKRLCEILLKIKDWWDVDEDLLKEAIENCCQNQE